MSACMHAIEHLSTEIAASTTMHLYAYRRTLSLILL